MGTPGIAEPESPVILINKSSGQTATVLSKPDGSFDNFIEAGVDDYLSAAIANKNGTRNTIPVSQQLFRDGGVGLFNGGGILEAQSDGGPVQVIIEPGAIEAKTKFNLLAMSLAEISSLLGGVEPLNGGKVLNGFKIKTEGDPLKAPAKFKMPLAPSSLEAPPGKTLADGVYALATPSDVDGVKVFEFRDDLIFQSGFLESGGASGTTNSGSVQQGSVVARSAKSLVVGNRSHVAKSHALGALAMASPQSGDYDTFTAIQMGFAGRMKLSGRFLSWNSDHTAERPVPGGTVFVNPSSQGGLSDHKLPSGAIVTTARNDGSFSITADVPSSKWFNGESFYMFGFSMLFPGKIGIGTANPIGEPGSLANPFAAGDIHIERSGTAAQPDFVPPEIFVTHSPADPHQDENISLQILVTDNLRVDSVTATLEEGTATIVADGSPQTVGQSMRMNYRVKSSKAFQTLKFKIRALDKSGNPNEATYFIAVGKVYPTSQDPLDTAGPQVDDCVPADGDQNVDRFSPIVVKFSETLTSDANAIESSLRLSPAAGTPSIQLGRNQREVYVSCLDMKAGTGYKLTIGNGITDVDGNPFDQIPDDGAQVSAFSCNFTTWADVGQGLAGMRNGVGVVGNGPILYALDRMSGSESGVRIYRKSSGGADLIATVGGLPEHGEDLVFIPAFSYYDAHLRKHQKDFVAVVGGNFGAETSRQWLWLLDVSNPQNPDIEVQTYIIRSPTVAVVKLAWSPPMLGYLQYDASSVNSIGLIDLQLLIYPQGLDNYDNEPPSGQVGIDFSGDGDYTDNLDTLPRPIGRMLRAGVFNGGLVGGYTLGTNSMGANYLGQITDFGLAFGGRFAAVTHAEDTASGVKAAYRTLAVNGESLSLAEGHFDFTRKPDRVSLMFGVSVGKDNPRILNLAMVSGGKPGAITVLNITDPYVPARLSEFLVPSAIGEPKSAIYYPAKEGRKARVAISGTQSVLMMDPAYLDWSSNTGEHPGFLGSIPNAGSSSRSFYYNGADYFAVNEGPRSRVVITAPTAASCPLPDIALNNKVVITPSAVNVLKRVLMSQCLTNATITSGKRNPFNQARVMYENIIGTSVDAQRALYGLPGNKVIDVYVAHFNNHETRDQIIPAMEQRIKDVDVGPCHVSNHCAEVYDTMDVTPLSISNTNAFVRALRDSKASGLIHDYILPPKDPAFHIEIPCH